MTCITPADDPPEDPDKARWTSHHCEYVGARSGGLMSKCTLIHKQIMQSDSAARTVLWWAAQNGHADITSVLLGSGLADPDAKDTAEQTPLMWAVRNSHREVVELLLKTRKVDVDACDLTGRS